MIRNLLLTNVSCPPQMAISGPEGLPGGAHVFMIVSLIWLDFQKRGPVV
jgi:hypothetical protein